MYRLNKYIIAVFLLIIFTQGIGMRLWMHHLFHQTESSKLSALPSSDDLRIKCDCFQDANMPFEDAVSFELINADSVFTACYGCADIDFSSLDKIYCSLKGPPSIHLL